MDFPLSQDITRIDKDFVVVTDHALLDHRDMVIGSALKSAGWKDGQWVKTAGSTATELAPTDATAVKNSFCVFTGSDKVSDPTTDTYATNQLTVIVGGGWVAKTKLFDATPGLGDLLVAISGKLATASTTAEKFAAVAVVVGPIVDGYLEIKAL